MAAMAMFGRGLPPRRRFHRPSPLGSPGGTGEDRSSEHRRGTLPARRGSETPGRGDNDGDGKKMDFLRCEVEMDNLFVWVFEWIVSLRYWRMSSSSCFFLLLIYTYMIIYVYVIFFTVMLHCSFNAGPFVVVLWALISDVWSITIHVTEGEQCRLMTAWVYSCDTLL